VFVEVVNGDPSQRTIFENCNIFCYSLLKTQNQLRINLIRFVPYHGWVQD